MAREAMTPGAVVLRADHVGVDYRTTDRIVTAVDEITLRIGSGSLTVLAGPSGSGKSSLLRALGLLDPPTRGTVHLQDTDTTSLATRARRRLRRDHLAYVHQRPVTNLVDDLAAAQQVRFARDARGLHTDDPLPFLAAFGLAHRARSRPAALSGGEQQRLAIAMAAAVEPVLMLADEPTAELDRHHADEVIAALVQVAASGRAVVAASHDPVLVDAAGTVVRLREGRMAEEGTAGHG